MEEVVGSIPTRSTISFDHVGWRRWVSKRFDPQKEAYRIRRIP